MTPREQVLQKLGLRTHPFWPDRDAKGQVLPETLWQRPLDPRKDPRVQDYYFDVYNWAESKPLVGPLASGKLKAFPARDDGADHRPALILISSKEGQTGRTSLANLILHTIQTAEVEKPILVEVPFGSDPRENVRSMAKLFIMTLVPQCQLTPEQEDRLWKMYDRETTEVSNAKGAFFTALFSGLRMTLNQLCDRSVIYVITGSDDYDHWSCAYNSSSALADYLVVQTSKPAAATTCLAALKGKRVAHVQAVTLDQTQAGSYVRQRLAAERMGLAPPGNLEDLWPFTSTALEALYKKGSGPDAKGPVNGRGISWLRTTLKQALLDHLDRLEALVAAGGAAALDALGAEALVIDSDKILRSREKLNQGPVG